MEQQNNLSESIENKKALFERSTQEVSDTYNSFERDNEGITSRLDSAESILNLAWEAWFTSKPKQAAWEINKLLPKLDRMLHLSAFANYQLRIQELAIRCHRLTWRSQSRRTEKRHRALSLYACLSYCRRYA